MDESEFCIQCEPSQDKAATDIGISKSELKPSPKQLMYTDGDCYDARLGSCDDMLEELTARYGSYLTLH